MFGALAAVALVVGAIGTAVSVNQNGEDTTGQSPEAVVEIQAVQSANHFGE